MLALLLPLLQQLAGNFPWAEWEGKGEKAVWAAFQNWVIDQWTIHREDIAAKLVADGWTYAKTTPNRREPPEAYVADIQYRLWAHVLVGGWPRDFMRDSHFQKIYAAVKDQITPQTSAVDAVRIVADAEAALTF